MSTGLKEGNGGSLMLAPSQAPRRTKLGYQLGSAAPGWAVKMQFVVQEEANNTTLALTCGSAHQFGQRWCEGTTCSKVNTKLDRKDPSIPQAWRWNYCD